MAEEMSTVAKHLPRYYKGYDMDILITKMRKNERLTEKEWAIIGEAQDVYYEKYFEKERENMRKTEEEARTNGIPIMKFIDPCPIRSLTKNIEEKTK